ncbi:hypothetical protein AAG570_011192 [Ranatra chinensis]|uniref:Uncharacterized protein n=1 Tax=Ranatra chinensis TaxID=642074 RepID=A0ABD0Z249_9HEMI
MGVPGPWGADNPRPPPALILQCAKFRSAQDTKDKIDPFHLRGRVKIIAGLPPEFRLFAIMSLRKYRYLDCGEFGRGDDSHWQLSQSYNNLYINFQLPMPIGGGSVDTVTDPHL